MHAIPGIELSLSWGQAWRFTCTVTNIPINTDLHALNTVNIYSDEVVLPVWLMWTCRASFPPNYQNEGRNECPGPSRFVSLQLFWRCGLTHELSECSYSSHVHQLCCDGIFTTFTLMAPQREDSCPTAITSLHLHFLISRKRGARIEASGMWQLLFCQSKFRSWKIGRHF